MAKARSPGYPSIGLSEAVEKVELVYRRDYQNAVPREVVASHMGYQSLNGKSLGVLAALGKYGLLEGRGNDTRVSDTAVMIIAHPIGARERVEALKAAAQTPELFHELDTRFSDGRASDQALRSYLLTQKFIPTAAEVAIKAYRDTKAMVQSEAAQYVPDPVETPMQTLPAIPQVVPASMLALSPQSVGIDATPYFSAPPEAGEPYRLVLTPAGGMELSARLLTVEDAEALRDDLDGFIGLLRLRKQRELQREEKQAGAIKKLAKLQYPDQQEQSPKDDPDLVG